MEIADDLVEEIMKRLPLESLFRFRLVCKGWNRLLRSVWAEAARKQPDLLICLPNAKVGCLIYSFLTRQWRILSFSFLPMPECTIKGCGEGLILLDISSVSTSCICNPLTGTFLPLPALTFPINVVARWVVCGQNRGSYKILLLGKCRDDMIVVQGYDSVTNSWNKMGEHDLGGNGNGECWARKREETAFCDGSIFWMGRENMVVFDSEERRWNRVEMPAGAVVRNNIWPRLVACGSCVLVVRLIKCAHVLVEVIMWELCGEKERRNVVWKEKGRMPEWVRGKLQRRWIECVGVGDYVCFRSHGSAEIVVYSLGEGTWQWLPKCPAAFINNSCARCSSFPSPHH